MSTAKTKTKESTSKGDNALVSPVFSRWLSNEAHVDDEPCVAVVVARRMGLNGVFHEGVVTVDLYDRDEAMDEEVPSVWGGSEHANLTPRGARELARLLLQAADEAEAFLKKREQEKREKKRRGG